MVKHNCPYLRNKKYCVHRVMTNNGSIKELIQCPHNTINHCSLVKRVSFVLEKDKSLLINKTKPRTNYRKSARPKHLNTTTTILYHGKWSSKHYRRVLQHGRLSFISSWWESWMNSYAVICHQCGYAWTSSSKLLFVVCPSCLRKTLKVKSIKIMEDK